MLILLVRRNDAQKLRVSKFFFDIILFSAPFFDVVAFVSALSASLQFCFYLITSVRNDTFL